MLTGLLGKFVRARVTARLALSSMLTSQEYMFTTVSTE